jgi:hypothetical protein
MHISMIGLTSDDASLKLNKGKNLSENLSIFSFYVLIPKSFYWYEKQTMHLFLN